jgi:hypothetical protein
MESALPKNAARGSPVSVSASPIIIVLLAVSFGLSAGFLDVGIILFKRACWNPEGYFRAARDFPWSVPLGHAVLLGIAGLVVATFGSARRHGVSLRAASWLFATLATWGALLRMPVYPWASLLFAAGLGRVIAVAIAVRGIAPGRLRWIWAALSGVLGALAAITSGGQAISEYLAVEKLPPPPRALAMSY